jgi:hypothetical protein
MNNLFVLTGSTRAGCESDNIALNNVPLRVIGLLIIDGGVVRVQWRAEYSTRPPIIRNFVVVPKIIVRVRLA